ncbi:MAG TPA: trypsin-like peptidase domain-containing protein [Pyrinomonadaceae bacterium]|nr:trypsin-like peptidase domain-containing protein [Pyrinomonadaceae bacterium]
MDRISNRFQPSQAAFTESPPAGISDPATVTDEQNNIEVYRALSPGVVFIHSTSYARDFFGFVEQQEGSGSGSILDQQGNILTNYHVIEGTQKLSVSMGGQKDYPATIVGGDPDTDLAVIRLLEKPAGPLTVVPMGDSDKLIVGQKVLAIGNPFGLDRTLTTGVISGLQRPIRARNNRLIEGAIQTDASINPGNSGGPLLDSHGRMIGINSQILSPSGSSAGVGFAVPVSIAKRVVPQLLQNGKVRRPKLGISTRDVEAFKNQVDLPVSDGVLIIQVMRGSGAAQAGLRGLQQTDTGDIELGDIIVGIDNDKVTNSDDLFRVLDKHQIGETVQAQIWRDGKRVSVPVRLMESPESRR